jgi:hypothetical protein
MCERGLKETLLFLCFWACIFVLAIPINALLRKETFLGSGTDLPFQVTREGRFEERTATARRRERHLRQK